MKKKLIRLTENDLHSIVKESINKVFTELDWKTYANAAEKQHGRNYKKVRGVYDTNREDRFKKAAADAFNKEYGVNSEYDDNKDYTNPNSRTQGVCPAVGFILPYTLE